jgi:transcriptional regulator with XRE-family HTH domain
MQEDQSSKDVDKKIWFSTKMKEARGEMSLSMLSLLSGLDEEYLSDIENGFKMPTNKSILCLATALEKNVDFFKI